MKRVIFTAITAIIVIAGNAQVYIGGGLKFWDNNDDKRTTISVTPEVGYRVSKRFAFGACLGYEYSKSEGVHTDSYSVEPYLRHFIYSFNNFDLFWEGTLEFCYVDPNNAESGYCLGIGAKPGISYTINDHFCITAFVGFFGYRHCEKEFKHPKFEPGLGISLVNDLSFSFHYYF